MNKATKRVEAGVERIKNSAKAKIRAVAGCDDDEGAGLRVRGAGVRGRGAGTRVRGAGMGKYARGLGRAIRKKKY